MISFKLKYRSSNPNNLKILRLKYANKKGCKTFCYDGTWQEGEVTTNVTRMYPSSSCSAIFSTSPGLGK
jgi:hypothetical protein